LAGKNGKGTINLRSEYERSGTKSSSGLEEHLAFDIGFALPRAPIKGLRWGLSEEERRAAVSIVEHLKLCGWQFRLSQHAGHGTGKGGGLR
jgi:hypothetical protein